MEDAAELEMLSKEKNFDETHKDRITQIFGDENVSEKLLADTSNSLISSKTQVWVIKCMVAFFRFCLAGFTKESKFQSITDLEVGSWATD